MGTRGVLRVQSPEAAEEFPQSCGNPSAGTRFSPSSKH